MTVADITLTVFTLFNSLRFLAYIPQIIKAINDESGAEAISFGTWGLFLASHASAMAYAIENQGDWKMASLFLSNATGCGAILSIAAWQRYRHRRRTRDVSRAVTSRLAARTCVAVGSWGRGKSAAVGSFKLTRPFRIRSGPALHIRIWSKLLRALHESRSKKAAQVVWRRREFVQDFADIQLCGRGASSRPERHPSSQRSNTP